MAIYKKVVILEGESKSVACYLTEIDGRCTLDLRTDTEGKAIVFKENGKGVIVVSETDGELSVGCEDVTHVEIAVIDGISTVPYVSYYGSTYRGAGRDALLNGYKDTVLAVQTEIKEKVNNLEVKEQFEPKKSRRPLDFYYSIKAQLDEMFICYPEIGTLKRAVPNSKWVKVDGTDGEYAIGVIYEEDTPKYVCYGVPSGRDCLPPENVRKLCQYISDGEEGYWVVFQSADTGETLTDA